MVPLEQASWSGLGRILNVMRMASSVLGGAGGLSHGPTSSPFSFVLPPYVGRKNIGWSSTKCLRLQTQEYKLVFGVDVQMDRVEEFFKLIVVGHARERCFGLPFLISWATDSWGSHISAIPRITNLVRG